MQVPAVVVAGSNQVSGTKLVLRQQPALAESSRTWSARQPSSRAAARVLAHQVADRGRAQRLLLHARGPLAQLESRIGVRATASAGASWGRTIRAA